MKTLTGIASVIYLISIYFISAHCQQTDFLVIFPIYSLSFASFIYLLFKAQELNFKILVGLGLFLRIILVFNFPNLSDDIYRFYWDGILWWTEIHPFDYLPSELMKLGSLPDTRLEGIFPQLNSPDYYTIYPPFCQILFSLSANVGLGIEGSSIFLKCMYLVGDLSTVWALSLLMRKFELSPKLSLLYFLNPMIILELVGNIHAEVWMVCFSLWMAYFLFKGKYFISGLLYTLAICSKILPLMFGPLILLYLWHKKEGLGFILSSGASLIFLFGLMLVGSDVAHLLSSINLYFQSFEFNASLYYLFRWLGYLISGYNQIALIGPALAVMSLIVILFISMGTYKKKINKPSEIDQGFLIAIALIFCTYLIGSTTVHPWYLSIPIVISIFTNFKYIYIWTISIILSYYAYSNPSFTENLFLVAIEYATVFIVFIFDISRNHNKKAINL